jgi:predicted alpha/beta-fold hydrolase
MSPILLPADYTPPALLRNEHLQSALASSALRARRVNAAARDFLAASVPEIIDCGDGVRLLAQHTPPPVAPAPLVVLLHGWEGSADSLYMVSAGARLWQAGCRVLRLNLRDHGGSEHLNPGIFHSCRLDEMVGAVAALRARHPEGGMSLAGWSLGGNFALRIAAAAPGIGLQLAQVVALCPVLDPEETMAALDGGFFGYRHYFLRKWRRSLELKAAAFPEHYRFGDLARFRYLEPMTEFFVTRYAGFGDLRSYLRGYALTGDRLAALVAPTTVLLADDDPVIPIGGLARVDWPVAASVTRSRFGGHCGFLRDWRLNSWLDDFVVHALDAANGPRRPA